MKKTRAGSKGEETRLRILNAAVRCLGKLGDKETTFHKIAEVCGVSQPLVVHYFQRRENILPEVLNHLLSVTLVEIESQLSAAVSPTEKMRAYIRASLAFIRNQPDLGRIYILFYYRSAFEGEFKKLNMKLKAEATERISNIIRQGMEAGEFSVANVPLAAKIIHNSVTGLVLNVLTEDGQYSDQSLVEELEDFCLDFLRH